MIRCIRVVADRNDSDQRNTDNFRKYYDDLFKAIGMDDTDIKYWGISKIHKDLATGDNLSSYGVPMGENVVIQVLEIDETKKESVHVHNYYDWSDYIFFANDGDENNKAYSMELLKCYTGESDVEQVVFKEDAIIRKREFKAVDNECYYFWRFLYNLFILFKGDFDLNPDISVYTKFRLYMGHVKSVREVIMNNAL